MKKQGLATGDGGKISAFIIAKNEADRIPRAVRSVRDWVDEVVVIDSGSTDETVKVCEALGARVVFNVWQGYGPQKVFGETLCRNDWILNIDADEEVSPSLRREIEEIVGSTASAMVTGYRLPVLPLYPFQASGHRWTISNYPIRLYRRSSAGFRDSPVHDSVIVREGSIGTLKNVLIHRSFRSLGHHLEKINSYTSAQAEDAFSAGRYPSTLKLLFTPIFAFFRSFILRREFVNGIDGVVISYMYAIQRFMKVAKIREIMRIKSIGRNV